ncbi:MAG: hypothetical protein PHD67_05205 [Oscillospiraceae bacterium]|nr:hypothetical protein [Oscillospiraceae bacterium]
MNQKTARFSLCAMDLLLCAVLCGCTVNAPFADRDFALSNDTFPEYDPVLATIVVPEGEHISDYSLHISCDRGKEYLESLYFQKIETGLYNIKLDLKNLPWVGRDRFSGNVKVMKKAKNITESITKNFSFASFGSYNAEKERIDFDLHVGYNEDGDLYGIDPSNNGSETSIDEDGAIEYVGFDNYNVVSRDMRPVILAPVLDFSEFINTAGVEPSSLWISFEDTGVFYEVKLAKQEPVNMLYSTKADTAIVDAYPDYELNFLSFPASPSFDFSGTLSWEIPDEEKEWYLYAIGENDELTPLEPVFNKEDGTLELRARTLGRYVLMDGPCKEADAEASLQNGTEVSGNKYNPETGSFLPFAVFSACRSLL